jgi:hypothetical protein
MAKPKKLEIWQNDTQFFWQSLKILEIGIAQKHWKLRDTRNLEHKKKNTHNTCFTPSFFVINAILREFSWWEGSSPSLHEFSTQRKESFNLYAPCLKRRKTRIILRRSLSKHITWASCQEHSLLKIILYTKQQKTSTRYLGWNLFDPISMEKQVSPHLVFICKTMPGILSDQALFGLN